MKYHNLNRANTLLLKNLIRQPFCFPGGYERVAITTAGACLCVNCLKQNFRTIMHSTKYQYRDGWQIAGSTIDAENEPHSLFCDHCSKLIN